MAHKKGGGTSRNGRDSAGQRYGVKVFAGELVSAGSIIVRQRGNRFWPGSNAGIGKDFTIYAKADGIVSFEWGQGSRRLITITPSADGAGAAAK